MTSATEPGKHVARGQLIANRCGIVHGLIERSGSQKAFVDAVDVEHQVSEVSGPCRRAFEQFCFWHDFVEYAACQAALGIDQLPMKE